MITPTISAMQNRVSGVRYKREQSANSGMTERERARINIQEKGEIQK